jgi:multisubunit Na+/H+ antiporter MnhE subunit
MYGYLVNAILIFLTHPGIIFPFSSPGILSGILQSVLVLTLNAPSDKAPSISKAAAMVYYIIFFLWAFIKARITMWGAVVRSGIVDATPQGRALRAIR